MLKEQRMVRDFHEKYHFTTNESPRLIPKYIARRRIKHLRKEVKELSEAVNKGNMVGIADAIGDCLYFMVGNAVAYGLNLDPIFDEIHRSNMTKDPTDVRDGKPTKGPDYSPPNIERILGMEVKE